MPATAGRVRMPANNRVHSSAALQTHGIWQSAIGYDPYAPNKDDNKSLVQDESSNPEPDSENAYANFQGLLALARITGSNANEVRGTCKKCGRVGHLSFQCRNFLSVKDDKAREPVGGKNPEANVLPGLVDMAQMGAVQHAPIAEESEEESESDTSDSEIDSEIERIISERRGKNRGDLRSEKEKRHGKSGGRRRGRSKEKRSKKRRADTTSHDQSRRRKTEKRRKAGISSDEDGGHRHVRKSRKEKRRRRSRYSDSSSDEYGKRKSRRDSLSEESDTILRGRSSHRSGRKRERRYRDD